MRLLSISRFQLLTDTFSCIEVFNGKRKYKPSGRPNTEGNYNGMGLSDKLRIEVTKEFKEEMTERRRLQREQQQQKRKQR